jgi:predicted metal-binding membrane protein
MLRVSVFADQEGTMSVTLATAARLRRDPGTILWTTAGACWLLIVGLIIVGGINVADHDTVIEKSPLPWPLLLTAFVGAWLVMIGAMMLPTTVPMVRLFTAISARTQHAGWARATFLAAYLIVWTGFALVALGGDTGVHALVDQWPWLHAREGLVLAGALAVAGLVQFSPLTQRCLTLCRDPRAFLYQHYRRGPGGAWTVGFRHGLSCLGCCWGLMLVMFATGVGSLAWMAGLTVVMVAEKTTRWGPRLVAPVGIVLLLAATAIAAGELVG